MNIERGQKIFDKQPRWFDYDFHPQIVTKVSEKEITVFEPGFPPNGKEFVIPIDMLFYETLNGKEVVCH